MRTEERAARAGSSLAHHDLGAPFTRGSGGMRARACVGTELCRTPDGWSRSRVSVLRCEAPLLLRPARPKTPEPGVARVGGVARVTVTAGAGGPIGGDRLTLHVEVGPGSCLVLAEVSPTLLLPGPHGEPSRTRVRIRVAAGATLIWLPEPVVAVAGCQHLTDVRVELDKEARLFMREEVLLGRHGEPPGQVTQAVRVRLAGRPLYRQDLTVGTAAACSPAVVGGHRAVGSTLIVDPAWREHPPVTRSLGPDAALLPLSGPAVVISALAQDNLELRAHLQAGLRVVGKPWDPLPDGR